MLEISNISKRFLSSSAPVLDQLSLKIEKGECLSLLGPSGCGKTTLLRILAGFETPDSGLICLHGQEIQKWSPVDRPFHMVFQRHALFPHLNVFENVAFGLRVKKEEESEIRKRVEEVLSLVRLDGFSERSPSTLSGGQSQRVALARALVNRPQVLLLDEPFSALDLKLREEMATELRELQKKMQLTFIFVTHDQGEAFALSDRVALMRQGRFEQISTSFELYHRPVSPFAARFVGPVSKIPVTRIVSRMHGQIQFESEGRLLKGVALTTDLPNQTPLFSLVRPESFFIKGSEKAKNADNEIEVEVVDSVFKGSQHIIRALSRAGQQVVFTVQAKDVGEKTKKGSVLSLFFHSDETLIFSDPGDQA